MSWDSWLAIGAAVALQVTVALIGAHRGGGISQRRDG